MFLMSGFFLSCCYFFGIWNSVSAHSSYMSLVATYTTKWASLLLKHRKLMAMVDQSIWDHEESLSFQLHSEGGVSSLDACFPNMVFSKRHLSKKINGDVTYHDGGPSGSHIHPL